MQNTPKNKIVVTCSKGIAPYLSQEISALGFPVLSESVAGVVTEGTMSDIMKLNLHIRTGHRVLFHLRDFKAIGPDDLYRELFCIGWEEYLSEDGYVCVESSVENQSIRDSRFANMRCKDAIVDRINAMRGRRPDSGPERKGAVIYLYWRDDNCSVYLNTSGEPLSKRGYRKIPSKAPLQETLAAALVIATGWTGELNLVNPMCGSGTIAIEAALIGLNKAPGLLRGNFSFMHLKGFDSLLWDKLRREARTASMKKMPGRILENDIRREAVDAAKKNSVTAGVDHLIEFETCDYADSSVPEGGGIIILNPGYGERLGEFRELEVIYKGIGDFFKKKCGGYRGFIFTGNPALGKKVGLRTSRKMLFYNSTIECRLLEYELYEGSRKRT